jgi:hypothetical protein
MEEIFELIKAFNRLKEKIVELIDKIDLLLKSPAPVETRHCLVSDNSNDSDKTRQCLVSTDGYVEEEGACRILHISPRTLAKLRAEGAIPYIKSRKKILYQVSDLQEYIKRGVTGTG